MHLIAHNLLIFIHFIHVFMYLLKLFLITLFALSGSYLSVFSLLMIIFSMPFFHL